MLHGSHSVSVPALSAGDGQVSSLTVVSLMVGCPSPQRRVFPVCPGSLLSVSHLLLCLVSLDQPGISCMWQLLPIRELGSESLVLFLFI